MCSGLLCHAGSITDSSTAAFNFIHIDTHSAEPSSVPSACVYVHKNRTKQEEELLSNSLAKLQLSHEGFPLAMKFTSSFFKARSNPGPAMSSGKIFLSKVTQVCSRGLAENLFYCTSA